MDREFAVMHNIQLHKLPSPVSVGVIDGRPIASGDIVEESEPIHVVLGNLASVISFNIISSPEHSLVLGLPWFELHNPTIDWRKRTIEEVTVQSESLNTSTRDGCYMPRVVQPNGSDFGRTYSFNTSSNWLKTSNVFL